MARLAVILREGSPGSTEFRLGHVLDFFGVPWKAVAADEFSDTVSGGLEYVVFGSIRAVAAAARQCLGATALALLPTAFYAYANDDRSLSVSALQSLLGDTSLSLQEAPAGDLPLSVSDALPDFAGPMSGLKLSLRLRSEDAVLSGVPNAESNFKSIISAGDSPVFLSFQYGGIPVFLCASSHMIDIDEPVGESYYDIKEHFCSVVPLALFIRFMFPEVAWRPQEHGACLIIDDPVLKPKYGFCNFAKLRDLMRGHGFTTNIAFIPWNWRRTSPAAGKFFRNESGLFSISIHGCDHTAGEFGATSLEVLHTKAQLARTRMRNHETRTGIQHDSIMVFPQGVFSSACPEVLNRNGFLAAVNTELVPVDSQNARTRIRDVWDVAIMAYGNFPIFTRRYAFHGLENFAFDLLLGKPCLIVAHHDNFKDGGAALIELIEKIDSLNCSLHWRPLGQVLRRACRRRATGAGTEALEMYGNELIVDNPSDQAVAVKICKRKSHDDIASEIRCDERPVPWTTESEHYVFGGRIAPHSENCFRVVYQEQVHAGNVPRSVGFELSVAARRILSEFRDDYLSTNRFLSPPAQKLKSVLRKAV